MSNHKYSDIFMNIGVNPIVRNYVSFFFTVLLLSSFFLDLLSIEKRFLY